jgi:hypothetical protein
MVVSGVGVEIAVVWLDHALPQQADLSELVQAVVDVRERDADPGSLRLLMQLLGGDMTVALLEQELRER